MAQVTVTINGKSFRMACEDGQEQHLQGLATRLDRTIDDLRGGFGDIGDLRLTVMAAISGLDALADTERRLGTLEAEFAAFRDRHTVQPGSLDPAIAARLTGVAEQIERLADRVNASLRVTPD